MKYLSFPLFIKLDKYIIKSFLVKNGFFLNEEYFDHLLDETREIRASEGRFYQKITDIYATAMDYSVDASITQTFFKTVQNKLHFAIHGKTAAERNQDLFMVTYLFQIRKKLLHSLEI